MTKEIREFSTFIDDIQIFRKWIKEHNILHVAMEITGVYWKPVFNVLAED